MKKRLSFYFDYISHNAYLAWTQLPALADEFDLHIEPVPVLFAGLLNAHGQLGPAEIPPKVRWMMRDVLRKAKRLNIPINPPASHPFNPLLPLRVTCQVNEEPARSRLIDELFKATWVEGLDVSGAEAVIEAASKAGLDGEALVKLAGADNVKQQLQSNTAQAIDIGVFGVPAMQVDDEQFWGFDDFVHLRRYLAGNDPLDADEYDRWLYIRPSSQRRRP